MQNPLPIDGVYNEEALEWNLGFGGTRLFLV
jgi:hypothetical protein